MRTPATQPATTRNKTVMRFVKEISETSKSREKILLEMLADRGVLAVEVAKKIGVTKGSISRQYPGIFKRGAKK